ncbi:MAG TPA: efflux RND transporter periplasmic adaptor subunit [Albitalea sp.]|nr:efflux RND transporter periplasmic adaptor subunit [Albitalea sp.]
MSNTSTSPSRHGSHAAHRAEGRGRVAAFALVWAAALACALATPWPARGAEPASVVVRSGGVADSAAFDGVVQAVRQTVVAAQVSGAVVALDVKAGDPVKAGQVLLRLDARAAEQTAAVSDAQVLAARASLQAATREFERQQQLFKQRYISQAALDRAEEQFRTTQATVAAQIAGAGAARTQTGFYVVKAPYSGVVADVAVVLGDMAMPGRPLVTLYDPAALRVSANVPQTAAARLTPETPVRIELPGQPIAQQWLKPVRTQILPTVDPATHTLELRLDLPAGLVGVTPGMFARAWLPASTAGGDGRLYVPLRAVVRRAELTAVYVVGADGRAMLRQVRLGRSADGEVEVLAGLNAGERVALEPQAAARLP